jgi:hypothetical protein
MARKAERKRMVTVTRTCQAIAMLHRNGGGHVGCTTPASDRALLDSWDRNNAILLNLLRALPEGGLEAKAIESSPSVAELFTKKFLRNWRQGAPDRAVLTVRVTLGSGQR